LIKYILFYHFYRIYIVFYYWMHSKLLNAYFIRTILLNVFYAIYSIKCSLCVIECIISYWMDSILLKFSVFYSIKCILLYWIYIFFYMYFILSNICSIRILLNVLFFIFNECALFYIQYILFYWIHLILIFNAFYFFLFYLMYFIVLNVLFCIEIIILYWMHWFLSWNILLNKLYSIQFILLYWTHFFTFNILYSFKCIIFAECTLFTSIASKGFYCIKCILPSIMNIILYSIEYILFYCQNALYSIICITFYWVHPILLNVSFLFNVFLDYSVEWILFCNVTLI